MQKLLHCSLKCVSRDSVVIWHYNGSFVKNGALVTRAVRCNTCNVMNYETFCNCNANGNEKFGNFVMVMAI